MGKSCRDEALVALSLLLHPHDITVIIIIHSGTAPPTSSFKLDG